MIFVVMLFFEPQIRRRLINWLKAEQGWTMLLQSLSHRGEMVKESVAFPCWTSGGRLQVERFHFPEAPRSPSQQLQRGSPEGLALSTRCLGCCAIHCWPGGGGAPAGALSHGPVNLQARPLMSGAPPAFFSNLEPPTPNREALKQRAWIEANDMPFPLILLRSKILLSGA
mmetsp:Transcript_78591/g.124046  ORF Transcript_78591/g.124046 Transcript_78591/m.124046 type:complete len:170 (+) Transcript_78591:3-512(+)